MGVLYKALYLLIFCAVLCVFTWFLLKIFPRLKKLNWKTLAIWLVIFKIFDIHSTYLCFVKIRDYESEANLIFKLFYKIFGFSPLWALIGSTIISVLLMIWLIKILIKNKVYFIAFCLVFGALLASINNYLGYFLFD